MLIKKSIQGGTSETMSSGFFNTIRQSLKEGWEEPISTYIVVHDSSTSSMDVKRLFELRSFLDKHYTEYCLGLGNHICLLFDLLQGNTYHNACQANQDGNTITYEGNAVTLLPLYDKIMSCPAYKVVCSMERNQLVPKLVTSPIERFIKAGGTCIVMDESKYTIKFTKM